MPSHETVVYILHPNGLYPNRCVVCENIAYVVHNGIALLIEPLPEDLANWWEHGRRHEMLYGSFLLVRNNFPCFCFHPLPVASIHFRDDGKDNLHAAIEKSQAAIDGTLDLPCLYNPYSGQMAQADPSKYITDLRAQNAYVDLFHAPQLPFLEVLAQLRPRYTFMEHRIRLQFVQGWFKKLMSASRHIHIAVHYFVNAARLVHENFPEDAGLNLNLVLEAIIEDFSRLNAIPDKRQAIDVLKARVQLPYGHMDNLEDLYWARNEYLAHIDDQMFTEMQNIGDPDRYCYEHFESVAWLIKRYVRYHGAEQ